MTYLSGQLPIAEASMHKADGALAKFEETHTVADITAQTQATVSQYTDNATRLAQLQLDQSLAGATLANVQGQMSAMGRSSNGGTNIASNPVLTQLKQQLAQVEVELADARRQYTEAHPTVIALEQQKTELQNEIARVPGTYVASEAVVPNPIYQQLSSQAANLQSQIAGDQSEMAALHVQQKQFSSKVQGLPSVTQTLANLQREAQLAEGVYTTMKQRYDDALVAKTLSLSNISVLQAASKQFAAILPNLPVTLALGLVLGLLLAVSGVFVIDFFDQSIKDETEVYRTLGLPVLASVPELSQVSKRDRMQLPTLRALTIEAFLQLVTSLRYSSEKPLRTLTVTSPLQGDGKSTVALNTAIAMAEMRPRVIVVDADLRFPTLHEKLGIPQSPGLTEVLVGENTLEQVVKSTTYSGLDVLTSGLASPNPIKLLQGNAFEELIAELTKTYKMVIFDTPALLPMIDATVVGARTDATVLVLAANHTDLRSAKRAMTRLGVVESINVLGVLLNRATPNAKESAYFLQAGAPIPLSGQDA
jgi:capsular exopolysaccharide synthesis family protein